MLPKKKTSQSHFPQSHFGPLPCIIQLRLIPSHLLIKPQKGKGKGRQTTVHFTVLGYLILMFLFFQCISSSRPDF